MSSASAQRVLRLTGHLCINPTDLSTAFPHGGTALGMVRDAEFRPNDDTYWITAEEWGRAPVAGLSTGSDPTFTGVLRDFDPDAVNSIFANTGTTAGDIKPVLGSAFGGTVTAGALRATTKLCFSPRAVQDHPFLILYVACPYLLKEAVLQMSTMEELVVAFGFKALPDSAGKTYQFGKRGSISIS